MPVARHDCAVVIAASLFCCATASVALAQTPTAPPSGAEPVVASWRMGAGYGWFGLRDVARTGRPVDASPVEWHGQGLTIEATHTRERLSRFHRFDVMASLIGDFEYRSPIDSAERPSADQLRRIDGYYEYRRYPFDNLFMDGFDVGIGVQAIGRFTSLTRHASDGISASESTLEAGAAFVVAARVRRWSRVQGEVAWTNGGYVGRLNHDHSEGGKPPSTSGGGWLTNLAAQASIRLTPRMSIAVRYLSAHDGLLAGHRNAAISYGSFSGGVIYAK